MFLSNHLERLPTKYMNIFGCIQVTFNARGASYNAYKV